MSGTMILADSYELQEDEMDARARDDTALDSSRPI
jgi:hypothetical protein